MNISVVQGQIPIKSITCHADHPDVKIFTIDSSAKYYQVSTFNCSDDGGSSIEVLLTSTRMTLNPNQRDDDNGNDNENNNHRPTVVKFEQEGIDTWAVEASSAKYSTYLVFWFPAVNRIVWKR